MREGVKRIATVVRWLAVAWLIGIIVIASVAGGSDVKTNVLIVCFVGMLPAALAFALAWIIDGFARVD
jgi:hypothetical protein